MTDEPFANFNLRTQLKKYSASEWAMLATTLTLIFCSFLFVFTEGLVPHDEMADSAEMVRTAGGQFEDVFIFMGAMFFATQLLLLPWAAGEPWPIVLKAVYFLGIWLAQLFALQFIKVGSILLTVTEGGNLVLAVWLVVFWLSAPLVIALTLPWLRRLKPIRV